MAFVNEYASDEDIEKYGLKEIWDRYHPSRKGRYFGGNSPAFTIDREMNVFLIPIGQGSGEEGNRTMFLLSWKGVGVRVDLKLMEGSSGKLDERPFLRIWDLAYLQIPGHIEDQKSVIIRAIKDSLRVYGYRGVKKQVPGTVVNFIF